MTSRRLEHIAGLHGKAVLAVMLTDETLPREVFLDLLPTADGAAAGNELVAIRFLADADPTPRHRYTQWLVRTYIAGGFLWEDLGKARETLELFHANRQHLGEAADLYRNRSLAGLWEAVAPFEDRSSNRSIDRDEAAVARKESVLFPSPEGWTFAVPMTERAAIWWGRGTRWCTAATRTANQFRHYHSRGPLVVAVAPDGTKFQGWVAFDQENHRGRRVHFTNAADASVSMDATPEMWAGLAPLWRFFSSLTPDAFAVLSPNGAAQISDVELAAIVAESMSAYAGHLASWLQPVFLLSTRAGGNIKASLPERIYDILGEAGLLRIIADDGPDLIPFKAVPDRYATFAVLDALVASRQTCAVRPNRETLFASGFHQDDSVEDIANRIFIAEQERQRAPALLPPDYIAARPNLWPELLRQDGRNIALIPASCRTPELLLLAAENGAGPSMAPLESLTRDIVVAMHRGGAEGGPWLLQNYPVDEELVLASCESGKIPLETPGLLDCDVATARGRLRALCRSKRQVTNMNAAYFHHVQHRHLYETTLKALPLGVVDADLAPLLLKRFGRWGLLRDEDIPDGHPFAVFRNLFELKRMGDDAIKAAEEAPIFDPADDPVPNDTGPGTPFIAVSAGANEGAEHESALPHDASRYRFAQRLIAGSDGRMAMLRDRILSAPDEHLTQALQTEPALFPWVPASKVGRQHVLEVAQSGRLGNLLVELRAFHDDAEVVNAAFQYSGVQSKLPGRSILLLKEDLLVRAMATQSAPQMMTPELLRKVCAYLNRSGTVPPLPSWPTLPFPDAERDAIIRECLGAPLWNPDMLDRMRAALERGIARMTADNPGPSPPPCCARNAKPQDIAHA